MAANSGPMPLMSSNIAAGADGVFRGKQRIPLGLHCLDLLEQQFEPVEFAANLGLQMIRQRTTIAGLELFQPLPPVATKRVVFGYPLGEQTAP